MSKPRPPAKKAGGAKKRGGRIPQELLDRAPDIARLYELAIAVEHAWEWQQCLRGEDSEDVASSLRWLADVLVRQERGRGKPIDVDLLVLADIMEQFIRTGLPVEAAAAKALGPSRSDRFEVLIKTWNKYKKAGVLDDREQFSTAFHHGILSRK